jgi:alpha-ketoglutarate-dependent taurine dioxygenase
LIETQSALRLGVFDERLVGLEDVDSGLAWRKEGSTVWFEPTSVVVCDTLRRLDDPDDVRFFAWRWDVRRAMAACQMFREKWGIDITNAGELKNSLIEINDKIGILPRVWPSRPALLMDRLLGYLEDLPTRARDVRWRFAAHRLGFDDWRELETGRYGKPVSLATRFRRTTGRRWLKRATPWRSRQVKETVRIEVQDGVCIKISRKDRHNGKGPAAGVLAAGEEVLRFDCFGPNRGHYHVYPKRQYPGAPGPIYFTEDSIEAQIDLSVREILENTQRYLRSGPTDSIRNIQIDPDRLAHACSEMRIRMRAQAGLQTNESRPNPEGPVGGGVSSGRSMEAKLLYPTFGCLVEVGPITADDKDGADLLALDINWVRSLFKAHGLILFRGFATSMHVFRAFSEQLCEKFRSHSNVTQRIPMSEDGTVVTTNLGLGKVLLHGEMYYLSEERRPNVLWFYCSRPPVKGSGGETTFVDATLLLERLSPATTRCFEHKRIVYPKDGKPGADGNGSTKSTVTNAISWTRHGERAFINSILNRYQHVGGRSRHPSMVHFEDGSPIPDEIIAELQAASERLEESLEWQAGDVVMVDNSWIMHGRRAFSGPREVVTRMANLRTP